MQIKKYALSLLIIVMIILFSISIGVGIIYGSKASIKWIYLDPGHGGFDGGTTSLDGQQVEKELTLEISIKLKEKLEKFGYAVRLTRDTDKSLGKTKREDILKRVELIESNNTLLYLSIHANAYPSDAVHGAQVFYQKRDDNKKLSEKIQSFIKELDKTNNRLAKPITDKYLVDHATKTGCLVEVGFLSNLTDLKNLQNPAYQDELVTMITLGIISYLGENNE